MTRLSCVLVLAWLVGCATQPVASSSACAADQASQACQVERYNRAGG